MSQNNPHCLHCVLADETARFLRQHPATGAQEMILDVISVLTELVCVAVVNTSDDYLTQQVVLDRMSNIINNVLPSEVAKTLPAFQAAASERRSKLL